MHVLAAHGLQHNMNENTMAKFETAKETKLPNGVTVYGDKATV